MSDTEATEVNAPTTVESEGRKAIEAIKENKGPKAGGQKPGQSRSVDQPPKAAE